MFKGYFLPVKAFNYQDRCVLHDNEFIDFCFNSVNIYVFSVCFWEHTNLETLFYARSNLFLISSKPVYI